MQVMLDLLHLWDLSIERSVILKRVLDKQVAQKRTGLNWLGQGHMAVDFC